MKGRPPRYWFTLEKGMYALWEREDDGREVKVCGYASLEEIEADLLQAERFSRGLRKAYEQSRVLRR